jgi:hypothetical protein
MKAVRYGDSIDFFPRSSMAYHELARWGMENMPPEAQAAIEADMVRPTVHEFLRLAGVQIEDRPPLTIDELIGPTRIGDLPKADQAFYFSGAQHPVLMRARRLPTFVTYWDVSSVNEPLGIRQEAVTIIFKGLVRSLFEDAAVPTFGNPQQRHFESRRHGYAHALDHFAVRRELALAAMRGDYRVGISGTQDAPIFNGYGRSLIRALYFPAEVQKYLELTVELEELPTLLVDKDDPRAFNWRGCYVNAEGMGYRLGWQDEEGIFQYIKGLLVEIGAVDKDDYQHFYISQLGFAMAVNALCALDKKHTSSIKNGHACSHGVHHSSLTKHAVQRAKSIALALEHHHYEAVITDEI